MNITIKMQSIDITLMNMGYNISEKIAVSLIFVKVTFCTSYDRTRMNDGRLVKNRLTLREILSF